MNESSEPGFFEQIPAAVRPLTDDGLFRLERIEYSENHYDIFVCTWLRSPEIDIRFEFPPHVDGKGNVSCTFIKLGNRFDAGFLFPGCSVDIPVHVGYMHEPPYVDYIQEISRISVEMKKNLPAILALFTPEKIEDTSRRYQEEMRKDAERRRNEGKRRGEELNDPENWKKFKEELEERGKKVDRILKEANEQVKKNPPGHREWQKGKFGEIAWTIIRNAPAIIHYPPDAIKYVTYHSFQDSTDILIWTGCGPYLFVHQESNRSISAYFLLFPDEPFIRDRQKLVLHHKMLIFPVRNVFRLLGIRYSYSPKEYLADLDELCRLIRNNSHALCKAFSRKNRLFIFQKPIIGTYNALIAMEGNNDEDIQKLIRHYFEDKF
jgi:hypothetical protein